MTSPCPVCALPAGRIVHTGESAFTIRDGLPVSPGHSPLMSKRHVSSFLEVDDDERDDPRGGARRVLPDTAAYWDKD